MQSREPHEFSTIILHDVGQAFDACVEFDGDCTVGLTNGFHGGDLPRVPIGNKFQAIIFLVGQVRGRLMSKRAAGIPQDEHKIAVVDTVGVHFQILFGAVGYVRRCVLSRRSIGSDVRPYEGKIACVAGPDPVVVLTAEFTDGAGRNIDKPDVADALIDEQNIRPTGEHFRHAGLFPRIILFSGGFDLPHLLFDGPRSFRERHSGGYYAEYFRRNVFVRFRDANRHAASGDLFCTGGGEKSVRDIILLF